MTKAEHIERHRKLHAALDELGADFLRHNPEASLTRTTIMDLAQWSYQQCTDPTPNPEEPPES